MGFKRGARRQKKKITLPTDLPTLDPTALSNHKVIFIVDLQSFSNKSCNRILNQALFSKLKENSGAIIFIVIKSKFSPKCRECGIGEKGDKLFLKDRFIKEGDGRVLFQLDSSISSLAYRKELCKYIYKHNTNLVILSEDRQYGYTIIGSDIPNSETEIYNHYFEQFDQPSNNDNGTTTLVTTTTKDSEGNEEIVNQIEQQTNIHHKTKEEQISELEIKTAEKVIKWVKDRIDKDDSINLPKTIESLENTIKPFCKVTHCFSNNAEIIKKLVECGDIKVCDTCQTCKPSTTNLDNQFYFSYLSLSDEEHKQFDWLLKKIISEYTKTPTNLVPIPLVNINKFTLSERVEIKSTFIIDYLIKKNIIKLKKDWLDQQQKQKESDTNKLLSSFTNDFENDSAISSNYSPSKKLSTPFKSSYSSSRSTTSSTPLKKAYSSSKYSYSGSSSSPKSKYDTEYKGKIIYL